MIYGRYLLLLMIDGAVALRIFIYINSSYRLILSFVLVCSFVFFVLTYNCPDVLPVTSHLSLK